MIKEYVGKVLEKKRIREPWMKVPIYITNFELEDQENGEIKIVWLNDNAYKILEDDGEFLVLEVDDSKVINQ